MRDGMKEVCVHELQKWKEDSFGKRSLLSGEHLRYKTSKGSSSLKEALLAQFKIWESTRNLHFAARF
jgi:hypothetical protein